MNVLCAKTPRVEFLTAEDAENAEFLEKSPPKKTCKLVTPHPHILYEKYLNLQITTDEHNKIYLICVY